MLCGFRFRFRIVFLKLDMSKFLIRFKKNKWNIGINNISNKWDDKKIKYFYFCFYYFLMF